MTEQNENPQPTREDIPTPADFPRLYTIEEAAALLRCRVSFVERSVRHGEFPHLRYHRSAIFLTSDHLRQIMAKFEVVPSATDDPTGPLVSTTIDPENSPEYQDRTTEEDADDHLLPGTRASRRRLKRDLAKDRADQRSKRSS